MEPPSPRRISIRNESARSLDFELVRRGILAACHLAPVASGEISVLVTNSAEVRRLNRTFRGIDSETDVLTFPADDQTGQHCGDIAISVEVSERQAQLRNVSTDQEIAFLAIHGVLHLAGLDDHEEQDRAEMIAKMNAVALMADLVPDFDWYSRSHEVTA